MLLILTLLSSAMAAETKLTITATVVASSLIETASLPVSINGEPVTLWTIIDGRARPCDAAACVWVPVEDLLTHDWTGYPFGRVEEVKEAEEVEPSGSI